MTNIYLFFYIPQNCIELSFSVFLQYSSIHNNTIHRSPPFSARGTCSALHPQCRRGVRTLHLTTPSWRHNSIALNLDIASSTSSTRKTAGNSLILSTRLTTNIVENDARQVRISRILHTVITFLSITTLDLNRIVTPINDNIRESNIAHCRLGVTVTSGVCLDSHRLGRLDHPRAGHMHILHEVLGTLSQGSYRYSMASCAGNILDDNAVRTGLEGHAVIVVRHVDVADGHICAGTDVEAVCVLRLILAFGYSVHVQIEELSGLGVALDGVEDIGGVLLAEV